MSITKKITMTITMLRGMTVALIALGAAATACADMSADASMFQANFETRVARPYQIHLDERSLASYKKALLSEPKIQELSTPEFVVLVNRHPQRQHLSIFITDGQTAEYIGSAKVSTGSENRREYFYTPTGLFENKLENGNYRALGTPNENGVRGLGSKGMRVFDFGWQTSRAGWGPRQEAQIRLQMHGTDPDVLERRLGTPASKGCVRIHHDVNKFIDENGVLDKNYDGKNAWVLSKNKTASLYDGRYMLVVDEN